MAVEDRYTDGGGADPDGRVPENLAGLPDYLHLLPGVAIVLEPVYLRDAVEGDLLRHYVGLDGPFAAEQRDGLLGQLLDGLTTGAGDGLVSSHADALDPDGVVDRLERHDELDGRAVGVGDDIAV